MSTLALEQPEPEVISPAKRSRSGKNLPTIALVAVLAILVLYPLIRLQLVALEGGTEAYERAFGTEEFFEVLRMTIALALGSVVIATVLGVGLAWCANLLPPKLGFLSIVPVLPIVLPAAATIVGWAFLLSPRPGYLNALIRQIPGINMESGPINVYTLPWIVILTGVSLTSFMFLFVNNGIKNLNVEAIEAARVGGSTSAGAFFRITLPLLRPVIVYGVAVVFLLGLGQFTAPLFLGRDQGIDVLTTLMYRATAQVPVDYATATALGTPLLIMGVLIVIGQRIALGNQSRFVTHSGKTARQNMKTSWIAVAAISVFGLFTAVLPAIALLLVALSPYWTATPQISEFSLNNFRSAFANSGITDAIILSVTASLGAVVLASVVGYFSAKLLVRSKGNAVARNIVDFLIQLPLGVPAVIFGVGFLIAYSRPPLNLYGTDTIFVLVYATLMLPFATRMIASAMLSLGDGYTEAARTSGAGALRADVEILLPLLRPALTGAAALMFVLLTHEFAASMLVRSPRSQVMGTVLYDYWSNGMYPMVAAVSLIMGVVTLAGVAVALVLGGKNALSRL